MRKIYGYFNTKQFTLLLITGLLMAIGAGKANAQANAGIWDSYIKLGGKDYYLGYSSTPPSVFTTNQFNKPALNGTNLGSFNPNAVLSFQGANFYGWKPTICCTGNICSAYLLYAVYPVGSSNPSFTSQQINNNGAQGNKGIYFWQQYYDTTLSVNILAGLAPGTYQLNVWASSTGSETGNDCNSSISTNGLPSDTAKGDYIATFTIRGLVCPVPPPTGTELVVNGNFDNATTLGFTVTPPYTQITNPTSTSVPNQFVVGDAAQMLAWNNSFTSNGDASGNPTGNFMGVDGSTTAGLPVWIETLPVTPNTVYTFSIYLCSFGGSGPAQLAFYDNNSSFASNVQPPSAGKTWQKFTKSFCSGSSSTVTLMITDSAFNNIGNDFGMDSISLRSSAGIPVISAGRDTAVCSGNPVRLNGTPGACLYAWFPQATLVGDSMIDPVATPTITTTYTLIATVPGCTNSNDTSHVIVNVNTGGGLPLTVTASPDSICIGQKSTLSVASGSGVYQWSPGLTDSTKAIVTVSPTITTSYTVTQGSGNCASTGQVTVTVSSGTGGTLIVTANPGAICPGATSALSVSAGSGSYIWSATGLTTTTSASINVTPATTTQYTAKAPGGACAAVGTVTVTVSNPTVGGHVTAQRDTICQNSSGNLSLTLNSSSAIQWQSSGNNTTYTSISGATSAAYKTNPLLQSTWYHAVVGTGFCTATSDSLLLYVPPALIASFYSTQMAGSKQLSFNSDSSVGAIRSYHWDFGDGQTSSVQNPTHAFAKDSTYYVCLTLYDGSNCSYTYCRYSTIADGVPTISAAGNWAIYPNPFSEQLTVSSKQVNGSAQSIELYDVLGQLVINKNLAGTSNTTLQLDVSSLTKGMYFVMIRTTTADYVQKVVKQ